MKKIIISVVVIVTVLVVFLLFNITNANGTCFNCGEKIAKDSSYCEHCGKDLKNTNKETEESISDNVVESSSEKASVESITTEKTIIENTTKNKTESSKPTTTQKAENNTATTKKPQDIPNADDTERKYFQQLYANEREKYILNISREINSLESEVSQLKNEASNLYSQYMKDKERTKERFADMGMLNSGAYQAEIKRLDDNYKTTSATYTKRITELENQIDALEREKQNPSVDNVLRQLAANNNMTYNEAVNKYNKYIAN